MEREDAGHHSRSGFKRQIVSDTSRHDHHAVRNQRSFIRQAGSAQNGGHGHEAVAAAVLIDLQR